MRIVAIGGTGHLGTFLVPRLVEAGDEVVCISKGDRPYQPSYAWKWVQDVVMDRTAEEATGSFGRRVMDFKPDVVIDLICFNRESARHLVEAVRGKVRHLLCCGTIWVHGYNVKVPVTEDTPRHPFGEYGIRKEQMESYLLEEAHRNLFPITLVHPGHLVGPGWVPLNPLGTWSVDVFARLAKGEELLMPHLGLETMHHVHVDDVAQVFIKAMANWRSSVGESFHAVSQAALTMRGYTESVAGWFGRPARLRFVPWEEYRATVSAEDAASCWDHMAHSSNCSMVKAQRLLGYSPRYSSLEAIFEALTWLLEQVKIPRRE
jgi:nucleoside-diphosphate-sugar epimerase